MLIVKAYAKFHCLNHDKNLAPIFFFIFLHSNITYIITDNLIVAAIFEVYVLLLLFLALWWSNNNYYVVFVSFPVH